MKRFLLLFLLPACLFFGCQKDRKAEATQKPLIRTLQAKDVFNTRATLQGEFHPEDTRQWQARGFLVSDRPFDAENPGDDYYIEGNTPGVFTLYLDNLTKGTSYYVKAYADLGSGQRTFAEPVIFQTDELPIADPEFTYSSFRVENARWASFTGKITSLGDKSLTAAQKKQVTIRPAEIGLYYWPEGESFETARQFTLAEEDANQIKSGEEFTFQVKDLTPETVYKFKMYLKTGAYYLHKTSYLPAVFQPDAGQLETMALSGVEVETMDPSPTTTTVNLNGKLISNGNDPLTEYGFYLTAGASVQRIPVDRTDEEGRFQYFVKDLSPVTSYSVRTFAKNELGEISGQEKTFTTMDLGEPMFGDYTMPYDYRVANITKTSARVKSELLSDGGQTLSEYGIYLGTDKNQLEKIPFTEAYDPATGTFYTFADNLSHSTVYYYQPYAVNIAGESKGPLSAFRTAIDGGKQYIYAADATNGPGPNKRIILGTKDLVYYELDTVSLSGEKLVFLDRNLGASRPYTEDEYNVPFANNNKNAAWDAFGYYYNWGRSVPSAVPSLNENNLSNFGWPKNTGGIIDLNVSLWVDNPCPEGYDIPTERQLYNLVKAMGSTRLTDFWPLMRLGVTGFRAAGNGGIGANGGEASLWTKNSKPQPTTSGGTAANAYKFEIKEGGSVTLMEESVNYVLTETLGQQAKNVGLPVRCVRIGN